jgi:acylphosphatase
MIRYQIVFTGKVQQVGFRYNSMSFAKENHCTGWVKNLANGNVKMEIQGSQEQIDSVMNSLESIDHIIIESKSFTEIPVKDEETFVFSF